MTSEDPPQRLPNPFKCCCQNRNTMRWIGLFIDTFIDPPPTTTGFAAPSQTLPNLTSQPSSRSAPLARQQLLKSVPVKPNLLLNK